MKPILILQHLDGDFPAYLETWLQRKGLPYAVSNTEAGQDFPPSVREYSALALLGGEMGANDPLPSLRQAEKLILEAMDSGVPTIGHCLGGQLMARALGARVAPAAAAEIGWQAISVRSGAEATHWFGPEREPVVFQWHYDAFELPHGATWLATSAACKYQAFSVGPHLAMQFHVELDAPKLRAWATAQDDRFAAASDARSVQSAAEMMEGMEARLKVQQTLADRIYDRWLRSVKR